MFKFEKKNNIFSFSITFILFNRVGIEHTQGESQNAYLAATCVKKAPAPAPAPIKEEPPATVPEVSDSDSDSN